ncbi:MAG TPA: RHS repeat-associated core domain-containing protein [Candidatus Polarisedimenticolaceae bacterium]|nr:RHS repeat-associated core domain-containing protein [Candidatus Polarisedimenticolaceae bacterium]
MRALLRWGGVVIAVAGAFSLVVPPRAGTGGGAYATPPTRPDAVHGASRTLLADGRWLVAGGETSDGPLGTLRLVDASEQEAPLPAGLRHPRAWHTANMLPDGRILVIGGLDAQAQVLSAAELVDLGGSAVATTVIESDALGVLPRAFHAATVVTDGRLLIAGGMSAPGTAADVIEIWDPRTGLTDVLPARLPAARHAATATLLSDGTVLLWGGLDDLGVPVEGGVRIDPTARPLAPVDDALVPPEPTIVSLEGSAPAAGAADVPIDVVIGLRFARPVSVLDLAATPPVLTGPEGDVPVEVVPAEDGRLVFLTPEGALRPASTYTVDVPELGTAAGVPVAPASLVFRTIGAADGAESDRVELPERSVEAPTPASRLTSADGAATDEGWSPSGKEWRTGRPPSPWQALPALRAAPGETALAGQVLRLDGEPLAKVTLTIDGLSVQTDRTGRFLVTGLSAGRAELLVDGGRASTPSQVYGVFEIGVDLTAGRTTALRYVIWMPKLDTEHAVRIPSPTTSAITVTTPRIPGLEVQIPAGTVIRDHAGRPVTMVSITPIPLDRPPFPLPGTVDVPIYFTLQPGGAYVTNRAHGVRLVYPNYGRYVPGRPANFWHYDPEESGWYVYGAGAVTVDGRQIAPRPGVGIYEFTGAMVVGTEAPPDGPIGCGSVCCSGDGSVPGCGGPGCGDGSYAGEPVNLASGLFVLQETDLAIDDVIPLVITRSYRQGDIVSREFGVGTSLSYGMYLDQIGTGYDEIHLILPDSSRIRYVRTTPGETDDLAILKHHGPTPGCPTCTGSPTIFNGSTLRRNEGDYGWDLTLRDGTLVEFGTAAFLEAIRDRFANTLRVTRPAVDAPVARITSPNGRWVEFAHGTADRITQLRDNIGRTVSYTYDGYGRLETVTNAEGYVTRYEYEPSADELVRTRMVKVWRPQQTFECPHPCTAQNPFVRNEYYDSGTAIGKVRQQTLGDGRIYHFDYTVDAAAKVIQTNVTNPRGYVRRIAFNGGGYVTSDTKAFGSQPQQTDYERQPGTNLVTQVTDPFVLPSGSRRQTKIEYDSVGLATRVTHLFGTATPLVTEYDYEPLYQQLTRISGPAPRLVTFAYGPEPAVRLQSITDATTRRVNLTLTPAGQVATLDEPILVGDPNAVQHRTTFTHEGGDLVAVTDPSGKTTRRSVDAVGRTRTVTDPLGHVTRYSYDRLDQVRTITDPRDGITTLTYDRNGNLKTVEDARQHETLHKVTESFYDPLDRLLRRRDPLGREEALIYDPNGNVEHYTDRRGLTTELSYDPLDRPTFAGFGLGNYTFYSDYDGANRLASALDSAGGPLTRRYDGADQLRCESTSAACPCGATQAAACEATDPAVVTYAYDAAGRRLTMTTGGQPAVSVQYQYDDADRLTQVLQGSASVTITLDPAGRREVVRLPNGITMTYGYDLNSRVSSIQYKRGDGSVLGGLTYTRDATGNVRVVGSDWARTGLPAAVTATGYDDANRLTQWGSTTLTYDNNGNVETETGGRRYAWNVRNQLSGITAPSLTASFGYDAVGRRRTRTVNGTATTYQHDGLNLLRMTTAGTTARLLEGLGLDEHFARNDPTGTTSFLTDQLGSTVALTDGAPTPAVTAQYTYEPFGKATVSGTGGTELQFTGRENDATDLYYHRARYYAPTWGRFIGEDPIRRSANVYAYVSNRPTRLIDPLGLYDMNVHLVKTWDWAREAGFCPSDASAIANANQGMDDDPVTQPFNWPSGTKLHFRRRTDVLSDIRDDIGSGDLYAFGRHLHSFQDSFAHEGFNWWSFGHVYRGHAPDQYDPGSARDSAMQNATRSLLRAYYAAHPGCRSSR